MPDAHMARSALIAAMQALGEELLARQASGDEVTLEQSGNKGEVQRYVFKVVPKR